MEIPRIAIVGAGVMGELHANVVAQHHGAELGPIIDVDENLAEELATTYETSSTTDLDAALDGVDACIIATPEPTHASITDRALDNDCNVLLEKPIAETKSDAERIFNSANETQHTVVPGHLLRFDPRYTAVADRIDDNELGTMITMFARRAIPLDWSYRMGDRVHPVKQITTHDVDLLRWYADSPVCSVRAIETTCQLEDFGNPDVVNALLTFESGTTAMLQTHGVWPDGFPGEISARLEVTGTNGGAIIRSPSKGVDIATDQIQTPDMNYWPLVYDKVAGALQMQFEHFLDCLRGAEPRITMEDAFRAFNITDAIVEATSSDKAINLNADYR